MKIALIVLDSFGAGALPDAAQYDDAGANTLGHIAEQIAGFNLPNLARLGLYELLPKESPVKRPPLAEVSGCYGKMAEASSGKDTPIGHWEITGIITSRPLPTYPDGFPPELIDKFERAAGVKTIGNYACSGTEILKQLGDEHYKTGRPIVYTSADSVFQIAAHEDPKIFGLEKLYKICATARQILVAPYNVGRVIARPFEGTPGNFKRTSNRHDYAIDPAGPTLLDKARAAGVKVVGIGKIHDIFNGRGIDETIRTKNNADGINRTIEVLSRPSSRSEKTLVFTNLVDFDMLWGHRRDVRAYYGGLREFDAAMPRIVAALGEDGLLFISADHGCDPAHQKHTDHTREYVPILVVGAPLAKCVDLGVRPTFADAGQTIADFLGTEKLVSGASFRKEIQI